ncbi:hypothetical protein BDV18DRAFT_156247 [Aspergillus unguis]
MSSLSPIAEGDEAPSSWASLAQSPRSPKRSNTYEPPASSKRNLQKYWRRHIKDTDSERAQDTRSGYTNSDRTQNTHSKYRRTLQSGRSPGSDGTDTQHALQRQPTQLGAVGSKENTKQIQMTVNGYVEAVKRVRVMEIRREVGGGTVDDPTIRWTCHPKDNPYGRVAAIEALCRAACRVMRTSIIWVRWGDHSSTRTISVTADHRIQKTVGPDDPHITVYMGNSFEYDYEGHLYIAYSKQNPRLPERLASPAERSHLKPDKTDDPICLTDRRGLRERAYRAGELPLGPNSHPRRGRTVSSTASRRESWRAPALPRVDTTASAFGKFSITSASPRSPAAIKV